METFKQFLQRAKSADYEWFSFEVDAYSVHILFDPTENGILTEAKHRGSPLGGKYSGQFHKAHSTVGQDHLHVFARNNQLFALNRDGTAHDQSHGTRIPNRVADAIAMYFPDFKLPKDNLIEDAQEEVMLLFREQMLCE